MTVSFILRRDFIDFHSSLLAFGFSWAPPLSQTLSPILFSPFPCPFLYPRYLARIPFPPSLGLIAIPLFPSPITLHQFLSRPEPHSLSPPSASSPDFVFTFTLTTPTRFNVIAMDSPPPFPLPLCPSLLLKSHLHLPPHQHAQSYVFNCATTFLLTNALKVSIGRPRPHFFIVCFPSGVPVYGSDGNVQCNGSSSSVMESRVSFPSGHTSSLTYAALFLAAKLQAFSARGRGQLWRLVPSACCLAGAASVGITRIDDYWHFPFDVFIGGLIVDDYWHFPFDVFVGGLIGRPPLHVLCAVLFVSREWMTTGTSPFDDFMGGLIGKRSLTRRHMPVQVEGEGPAVAGGAISMQPGGRCFHGHHSS
ncbi:unnamed protein product [Closterium sp. NIES-64]|nr:unnamed protein product [Closterium sp. NIES-64]